MTSATAPTGSTSSTSSMAGGAEVKIVALTASAFEEDRRKILAAGCDDMLRKPVEEARLFALMRELLGVKYRETAAPRMASAPPLEALDLSAAPPEWLRQMHRAAETLDMEGVLALAEQLRGAQPALAQGLAALAESYRLDRIFELCAEALQQEVDQD